MTDKNADDIALIRELATILGDTDLTEIEISEGEKRVKVKREITHAPLQPMAATYMAGPAPMAAPAVGATAAPAAAAPAAVNAMTSPMVGTAYLAAKPGDPPFVRVGDAIKEGQTMMIIEAMKVMNPIKADRSGTLSQILVTDAEPLEFGQPLFVIG